MPIPTDNILLRLSRKGLKESCQSLYYRVEKPLRKRYLRRKYTQLKGIMTDKELFSLITVKRLYANALSDSRQGNYELMKKGFVEYLSLRRSPVFFTGSGDSERKKLYIENFPEEMAAVFEKAELVCTHSLGWITPGSPDFDGKIVWRRALRTPGRSWENKFFMDLDYSGKNGLGDIREVWELNRHQHLIALGKAYYLSGDERYAREFTEEITDWIEDNPCGYGINWLHSQETALRMVSWIWAFYFFKDSRSFTADKKILFIKSLYRHAEYTFDTLSRRVITHNHLISEVCGLAVFCLMFPEFKRSKKWLKASLSIFRREVIKQIWEDGPSAERATNYHCFVLESFLQLVCLLRLNGHGIPEGVLGRVESMINFIMHILRPDGTLGKMGDNDSGKAFRLREQDTDDRRGYLAIGAVLFGREDFKYVCGKLYEEAFWLLGNDSIERFDDLGAVKPGSRARMFENAGICVFRDSWRCAQEHFVFRGGPLQMRKGVSTSHNHADLLSFEYYFKGHTFFIDPGTYLYGLDDNWRSAYRRTFSHNTVAIDDNDQFDVTSGRFGIGKMPTVHLHGYSHSQDFDYVDMSYDDKSRGISHRRRVIYARGRYILLVDQVSGAGKHSLAQYFNIDQSEVCIGESTGAVMTGRAGDAVNIIPLAHHEVKVEVMRGGENSSCGWASYDYGEKHPSAIIRFSFKAELPFAFATLIVPEREEKLNSARFFPGELFDKAFIRIGEYSDILVLGKSGTYKFERISAL